MSSLKSLIARSALPWAVEIAMLLTTFSLSGQVTPRPSVPAGGTTSRITAAQTAALLKQDPTLSSGFKSPKNLTVRVVKPVEGGVELSFNRSDGAHGNLTVVGPPTVMEKGFWTALGDWVMEAAEKLLKEEPSTGGGSNSCANINISGNSGVVIVTGNASTCTK